MTALVRQFDAEESVVAALALQQGDEYLLLEEDGDLHHSVWRVLKRVRRGWRMEATIDPDVRETWSDVRIRDLRLDKKLKPIRRNPLALPEAKLERVTTPIETKAPRVRLELEVRKAYCDRVEALLAGKATPVVEGPGTIRPISVHSLEEACGISAREVFDENIEAWRAKLRAIRSAELSAASGEATLASPYDPRASKAHALHRPSAAAVEKWYETRSASDRPDVILTPDFAARGNRSRRKTETIDGIDVYTIMREFGDRYYACAEQVSTREIYRLIVRKHPRFKEIVRDQSTLQRFFNRTYKNAFELDASRSGRAKATRDFMVFPRSERPSIPMEEIEIDHCLADLIVVDEVSRRPLGRPWITAAIDRCSRMIVGMHVSFELPSWASVSRCLAHAFWPKDLRAFRQDHGAEGDFLLEHDWPCEGIPKQVITDRGNEFCGHSLEEAADALGFAHGLLPGRSPWLKGTIERFFGTMHAQVYSHLEGKTFANAVDRGDYDSVKVARIDLAELRARLLKWVVDEYHVTFHQGLGDYPLAVWLTGMRQRFVKPAPSIEFLHEVLGQAKARPISKDGVRLNGHRYFHESFSSLRRRYGLKQKYHVRFDPFDLGTILLLPPDSASYIEVHSDRPEETVGVSLYQSKIRQQARKRFGDRMSVADDWLLRQELDKAAAAEIADVDGTTTIAAIARYRLPNGMFLSPVSGWDGKPRSYEPHVIDLEVAGRPNSVRERPSQLAIDTQNGVPPKADEADEADEAAAAIAKAREMLRRQEQDSWT